MENIFKKNKRRIFIKPTILLQDTSDNTLIYCIIHT